MYCIDVGRGGPVLGLGRGYDIDTVEHDCLFHSLGALQMSADGHCVLHRFLVTLAVPS